MDEIVATWLVVFESGYDRSLNLDVWRSWADAQILRLDVPPDWLCELSLAPSAAEARAAIAKGQGWEESARRGAAKTAGVLDRIGLYLGLLYFRFLRGDLDMTDLLRLAGERTDRGNYRLDCSVFSMLLNETDGRGPIQPGSRPLAERVGELFSPFAELANRQLQLLPT
jgi:hypothetical protein